MKAKRRKRVSAGSVVAYLQDAHRRAMEDAEEWEEKCETLYLIKKHMAGVMYDHAMSLVHQHGQSYVEI